MPPKESSTDKDFDFIKANWSNHGGGGLFKYDDLDAVVIDQGVHMRLRFSATIWPECFSLAVRGTKGSAFTDLFQPYLQIEVPRKIKQLTPIINQWNLGWHLMRNSGKNFLDKLQQKTSYEGLGRFLEKAYQAIKGNADPPVTIEDMDRVSKMIDILVAQARSG
jgi:hypothetical protein